MKNDECRMKREPVGARPKKRRSGERIIFPTAGNATGRKFTEAEYRAMVEKMYEEEAERIMKGFGHSSGR
jgi:hypothetical protein